MLASLMLNSEANANLQNLSPVSSDSFSVDDIFTFPLNVKLKNTWVTTLVFTLVSRCNQDAEEMLKIAMSISETLESKVSSKWVSWVISNILSCLKVVL